MSSDRRLHPASILFTIGAQARQFVVPGLLLLVTAASSDRQWDLLLMLLLIPYSIYAVVRYATFRYRYDPDELVITSGLIFRNERHIPYARIQNIDAVQNVVHRLIDVVTVRVHTGAGQEPEATLSVLPRAAFDEMQSRVGKKTPSVAVPRETTSVVIDASGATTATDAPADAVTLLRLPTPEVMLCGFIENYGGILIGAGLGLLWEAGLMDRVGDRIFGENGDARGPIRALASSLIGGGGPTFGRVLAMAAGIAVFLLVLRALSMGVALLRLHGFTLTRVGDDLRTEYGLLTRVAATIPMRRVQTITIHQGPVQRLFGRMSIGVATAGAGGAGDGQGERLTRVPIAPIVTPDQVDALVAAIVPDVDAAALAWQPVHPRARRRITRVTFITFGLLTSPLAFAIGWWHLAWLAALAAWSAFVGVRHAASLGWAESGDAVAYRSGWLWRQTTIARMTRIQVVALHESPFDRRHRMAGVQVDTAGGGPLAEHVDIPYLARTVAQGLYDRLSQQAARTAFKW